MGCQATRGGLPIGRAEHSIWLWQSQPEVIASLIGQGVVWWEGQRPPSHRACLRTQTEQPGEHPILHLTPVGDTMHVGDGGDGVVIVVVVDVKT